MPTETAIPESEELALSVHHIRASSGVLAVRVFIIGFLIETIYALILLVVLSLGVAASYPTEVVLALWVLQTLKFILESYFILRVILSWLTTTYYLRESFLVVVRGVWHPKEDLYDLRNVRSIEIKESRLGRLLNYGTLKLIVASSGFHEEVELPYISDVRKYERWLRSFLAHLADNQPH